jgi:hypothetical protein
LHLPTKNTKSLKARTGAIELITIAGRRKINDEHDTAVAFDKLIVSKGLNQKIAPGARG